MKTLTAALTVLALGTAAQAQDLYVGATADYHFPHSGDAQTVGSIVAGPGLGSGPIALGAEVEAGFRIAGENDYDTSRVRIWTSYDWGDYRLRFAGGVTEYYFGGGTAGGYNFGLGAERALSDRLVLRGEVIRDFMDTGLTSDVTATRIGVIYSF